jgi:hypothetical protein
MKEGTPRSILKGLLTTVLEKDEPLSRRSRLQATGFRLQQKIDLMPVAFTHLRVFLSEKPR